MVEPAVRHVLVDQWRGTFAQLRDSGADYFDFLAATDLGDGATSITAHVLTDDASTRYLVTTELKPGDQIESLASLYPGASWHEREAADLVGVTFANHPDLRPLIWEVPSGSGSAEAAAPPTHPLLRSAALPPRIENRWPGLDEPGVEPGTTKRRRPKSVPGNPPEWTSVGSSDD
ncbi:MAG: NADH-quinone oxidoreductase subunit C [Candidatus Nanopelagicales bacterium]